MDALEIVKFSANFLTDRKLRSVLTILMVAVGVGLITALNGMTAGMNVYIQNQLATFGANVLTVSQPTRYQRYGGAEATTTIINNQIVNTVKALQGVKEVVPYVRGSVTLISGNLRSRASIIGIDQTKYNLVYPTISAGYGGLLAPYDISGIVLGSGVAQPSGETQPFANYGQTVIVQYTVLETVSGVQKQKEQKRTLQVKGILNEMGNPQVDNAAIVSIPTASTFFQKTTGTYDGLYVVTEDSKLNADVTAAIIKLYGSTLGISSPTAMATRITEMQSSFTSFLLSIAAISLIVGSIGIITTLYTSVMERTREIGTMKALGFSSPLILVLFLVESFMIGIIGGITGVLLGMGGAGLLQGGLPMMGARGASSPIFLPSDILFVLGLAVLLSVTAGLYPAWRASSLDPIVALRKE